MGPTNPRTGDQKIPTYHNSLVQLAEKQQRERELARETYLLG